MTPTQELTIIEIKYPYIQRIYEHYVRTKQKEMSQKLQE
jgi:hypothetical protein